jgi:hypothetical protein
VDGGGLRVRMIVEVLFGSTMLIFVVCALREAVDREIKREGWLIRI